MRTFLFILALFCIISIAVFLNHKNADSSSNKPFKIAPQNEWHSILLGAWNYHSVTTNHIRKFEDTGLATFNENGTYEIYITAKSYPYNNDANIYYSFAEHIIAGSFTGNFEFENAILKMVTTRCKLKTIYKDPYRNDCIVDSRDCFSYGTSNFGSFKTDTKIDEVIEFNSQKLLFKEQDFSSNDVVITTLYRRN